MTVHGELLIVSSTPVIRRGEHLVMDKKFVAGAALSARLWGGPVRVLARESNDAKLPFATPYLTEDLPFSLHLLKSENAFGSAGLEGASAILASGDDPKQLFISKWATDRRIPVTFTIENPLWGSLEIIWIERQGLLRRLKASIWAIITEYRRRQAFRLASGLQANGTPAQHSYRKTARQLLPFFDTRMATALLSTDEEIETRAVYRKEGHPLRLAFSGRLERIKGVDHLLKVARHLNDAEFPFTLDVYGIGAMEADVHKAAADGLLRYHGAVEFDTELAPSLRVSCDLFISCHLQSDPSCTYLEALGCGTPILGYGNRAFRGLMGLCDGGWIVRNNFVVQMVAELMRLDRNRHEITRKAFIGRDFSRCHSFEMTFERRIAQLRDFAAARSSQ